MKRVSLEEIKIGMVLAEDLIDMSGRILLKKGAVLNEKYIEIMVKWGFPDVAIESEEEGPQGPPPVVGYQVFQRPWEDILHEINHKFELVENQPLMAELKKNIVERFSKIKESYSGRL